MNDSQLIDGMRKFLKGDRGVSPVIAVALLILIAIGFAVAIQGVGSDLIGSVQEPPEASIDSNPEEETIRLTVENVQNADELRVLHNGENKSNIQLSPQTGDSVLINYADDLQDSNNQPNAEEGDEISVVAVDFPDNERVVFSYTIPEDAVTS